MSDLTYLERVRLERHLDMGGGYVLDFSNRTFREFVLDSTGKDIYAPTYDYDSGSKANRLRAFWKEEPNHLVGKLIADLLTYRQETALDEDEQVLHQDCHRIARRLQESAPVAELAALTPNTAERDLEVLARSVREAIEKNEPEAGLDRLHTFVVRYLRVICAAKGISTERTKPLHSLLGEYVKCLRRERLIDSQMTERILKTSISTLEAFNRVRNEQSYAHDNPVLNYSESLLIFNHVASAIRFIASIEAQDANFEPEDADGEEDDSDEILF